MSSNCSVGRMRMLKSHKDLLAFEQIMLEAYERFPLRILSYCLMRNHWHFVAWPEKDGQLTAYFRWLAHTHAMRWRVSHNTVGYAHLYQGRYKSFPVEPGASLLQVCRYVERNALTAGLVQRAQQWRWSSPWVREHGTDKQQALVHEWPVPRPGELDRSGQRGDECQREEPLGPESGPQPAFW